MILPLATLLLTPLQGPAPVPGDDEGWRLLDGVAAQAGDGIVTMRTLDLYVRERIERQKESITSQEEYARVSGMLSLQGLRALMTAELEAQGGQDMGISEQEIGQIVSAEILNDRKRQGAASYLDELEKDGTDPLTDESRARTKKLYRLLWARSKLGFPGPAGTRATRRPLHPPRRSSS